jgi:hypothetical protein
MALLVLEQVLPSDPGLAAFNGRTHGHIVAEFIRLDRWVGPDGMKTISNRISFLPYPPIS